MSKDPAVLFYTSDFISGTELFSFEQKGQYIHLLCIQHQNGHLPTIYMEKILGERINPVWNKFIQDDKGCWYQERMDREKERRVKYTESRRKNVSCRYKPTYVPTYESTYVDGMKVHMETDTDTITNITTTTNTNNNIITEDIKKRTTLFEDIWSRYPKRDGKKASLKHFLKTVKTKEDWEKINIHLGNYLESKPVVNGFIKNGSTWFNNWEDEVYSNEQHVESI